MNGCAGISSLPPVNDPPTDTYYPGQVIWHDLATPDLEQAKAFYGEVFGWTFEDKGEGTARYSVISYRGEAIGGMVPMAQIAGQRGEWVCSCSATEVEKDVDKVLELGGKILGNPINMKGRGMQAVVADPQGAVFGLLRSSSGDPAMEGEVEEGEWLYTELWAQKPEPLATFYSEILGYSIDEVERSEIPYWAFLKQDKAMAGLIQNPVEYTRSHWVPYIKVNDAKAMTSKAEKAGATVLLAPNPKVRNGSAAFLLDPTGAPFVIQKYPY